MYKKIFPVLAICTVTMLAQPACALNQPAVSVNSYVMDRLGPIPTVPSNLVQYNDAQKSFAARPRPVPTVMGAKETPLPPRQKPKSRLNQHIEAHTAPSERSEKFKTATKSTFNHTNAIGGTMAQSMPSGNFAQNVMAATGYRWNDIDPRTRGAVVMRTQPMVVGSVVFERGDTDLDPRSMAKVKQIGGELKSNDSPAELQGFASADKNNGASARRTALTRVLAVRDALMNHGISGSRLEVKPMGIPTDNGPKDRVDVVVKR